MQNQQRHPTKSKGVCVGGEREEHQGLVWGISDTAMSLSKRLPHVHWVSRNCKLLVWQHKQELRGHLSVTSVLMKYTRSCCVCISRKKKCIENTGLPQSNGTWTWEVLFENQAYTHSDPLVRGLQFLKPQVWHYDHHYLCFFKSDVTIFGRGGGAGAATHGSLLRLYPDWIWLRRQGSHALKQTILYCLFYSMSNPEALSILYYSVYVVNLILL